ncbi:MAG: RNA-guided endonuclease InsQ/TnpB family protein [Candidatus Thorarchaeota archaeon]
MLKQVHVFRTERIWIKPHPMLRKLCHLSKNVFNEANYFIRQIYFATGTWIKSGEFQDHLEASINFQTLPRSTALKILSIVEATWKSFFAASRDWKVHPEKYYRQPRPPKYKRKDGEFLLWFSKVQLSITDGRLHIPSLPHLQLQLRLTSFQSVLGIRIVPQGVGYVVEILYKKKVPATSTSAPKRIVGIDLGLVNLITLVNNIGQKPIAVKGGVAKSINQFYNKERAHLQGIYSRQGITTGTKLFRLNSKRKRKFNHYFHEVSRFIVDWCKAHHIDTLIIGRNKHWKQGIHLGKKTTQNFIFIPFQELIKKIHYKATAVGIRVWYTDESYTSKCSFLDAEPIARQQEYLGARVTRGLFQSQNGTIINSDVNGGYNIVKKAVPNAFADGIEGVWLHPIRWRAKEQPGLLIADKSG